MHNAHTKHCIPIIRTNIQINDEVIHNSKGSDSMWPAIGLYSTSSCSEMLYIHVLTCIIITGIFVSDLPETALSTLR